MNDFNRALRVLFFMTLLTGMIYPLCTTWIAQYFFPEKAAGSLITRDGKIIGSHWIGQSFSAPHYFWSRPSATTPYPYNAENSTGSNLGPSNVNFIQNVKNKMVALNEAHGHLGNDIPIDLVMGSASGLDPDISVEGAYYQATRVAQARKIQLADLEKLIAKQIQPRFLNLLGEARVNVLELNLALDRTFALQE